MVLDMFVTFFPAAVRLGNQDSELSPSEISRWYCNSKGVGGYQWISRMGTVLALNIEEL